MIDPKTLQILNQKKYAPLNSQIIQYDIDIPLQPSQWDVVFGIDPGNKNMGITCLPCIPHLPFRCYEIIFPSQRVIISRVIQIRLALREVIGYGMKGRFLIAIEGAAYSMPYRNTELAEARVVAAEWFLDNLPVSENDFIFITPQAIRKAVFGSAKIKAETQWPQLKGDAASSLAIALAGLALKSV